MDYEKLSLPNYDIPEDIQNAVAITTLDRLYNWGRRSSVWPLMFGLACCAIEMIAAQTARYDMARFGMEVMRPTPRQADMMLVSGTVTKIVLSVVFLNQEWNIGRQKLLIINSAIAKLKKNSRPKVGIT